MITLGKFSKNPTIFCKSLPVWQWFQFQQEKDRANIIIAFRFWCLGKGFGDVLIYRPQLKFCLKNTCIPQGFYRTKRFRQERSRVVNFDLFSGTRLIFSLSTELFFFFAQKRLRGTFIKWLRLQEWETFRYETNMTEIIRKESCWRPKNQVAMCQSVF